MKHLGTGELSTPRLTLRRFRPDDAEAMYRNWASDDEVTKYLMWPTHADSGVSAAVLEDWVKQYEQDDYYQWAIILRENGDEPIGSISVVELDDKVMKAHIGYCIGRKWWHQGITSEALDSVIHFLFEQVGMRRIEARHDPRNPHSGGVMQKCGMKFEAVLRQSDWNNQGICDAAWYAILADEV